MIGKGTGIMTAVSFKSLCLGGVNDVRALHGADRRQGNHLSGRQEPFMGNEAGKTISVKPSYYSQIFQKPL